jgi:hypothetical protein
LVEWWWLNKAKSQLLEIPFIVGKTHCPIHRQFESWKSSPTVEGILSYLHEADPLALKSAALKSLEFRRHTSCEQHVFDEVYSASTDMFQKRYLRNPN